MNEVTGVGKKDVLSVDQVLSHIGEFGKYQKLLDFIFCLLNIPLTFQVTLTYFITLTPDWKCVSNSTLCLFNGTQPNDDNRRCSLPRSEWQYVYPKDYSLITQFNMDCDNAWLSSLITSMLFIGWVAGSIPLGWISDKYGRKVLLTPSISFILIFGFISSFLPNIYLIATCRFLVGFLIPGTTYPMLILISELVGNKKRPLASLLIWFTCPIGFSILALKANYIRKWKLLSIVCSAPYFLLLAFHSFIPESVRWLQSNGRINEAMAILRKIARWNKKNFPSGVELSPVKIPKKKSPPLVIFRNRNLAGRIFTLAFIWFAAAMGYYGLYLAADDLGGSPYINFFIMSMTEIPSIALAIIFCDKLGRKPTTLLPLLFGSVACLAIAFIARNEKLTMVKLVIGMLGKSFISITMTSINTWVVEIIPTNVRVEGVGFMQVIGHIGSACSPFIAKGLKIYGKAVPFAVIGGASVIGSIIGVWLPETKVRIKPEANECYGGFSDIGASGLTELQITREEK